jgi:hypothetical protein
MGQSEVIEVLNVFGVIDGSRVPLSKKEIASILKEREDKITHILSDLLKSHEVQCQELDKNLAWKFYKCKRKMRLYYV